MSQYKKFSFFMVTFLSIGYFALHGLGLGGNRGYLSLSGLNSEVAEAQGELSSIKNHRHWLEHRISLVSEGRIDADILGELARSENGLFAPDEIIININ